MYSDLDKKSKGGYIIEDALVLSEIFSTALNVKKGQIFYGRQYGCDFEQYLLRLNEADTLFSIQSELYGIRNMDGRMMVDPGMTELYGDTDDEQKLVIQTALNINGLPQLPITGMVEDNEEEYLTIQDFIDMDEEPWATIEGD